MQSHEDILQKLDASAADVQSSLSQLRLAETENKELLSENEALTQQVIMLSHRDYLYRYQIALGAIAPIESKKGVLALLLMEKD